MKASLNAPFIAMLINKSRKTGIFSFQPQQANLNLILTGGQKFRPIKLPVYLNLTHSVKPKYQQAPDGVSEHTQTFP